MTATGSASATFLSALVGADARRGSRWMSMTSSSHFGGRKTQFPGRGYLRRTRSVELSLSCSSTTHGPRPYLDPYPGSYVL